MTSLPRCLVGLICAVLISSCQPEKPPKVQATSTDEKPTPVMGNALGTTVASQPAEKGGGRYEVRGEKKKDKTISHASSKGSRDGDELIEIEIDWPITKEQFDDLKVGMSTFRVKNLLELSKLDLEPKGSETRFQLVCKNGNAKVTLVFSGSNVELASKNAEGVN